METVTFLEKRRRNNEENWFYLMPKQVQCFHHILRLEGLEKFVSVNSSYRPIFGRKGRKGRKLRFRKDANVIKFQDVLAEKLDASELFAASLPLPFDHILYLNLGLKFFLKKRFFFKRDGSNFLKSTEDAICKKIGIDDRFVMNIYLEKIRTDQNATESLELFLGFHISDTCFTNKEQLCPILKKFRSWMI